MLFSCKTTKTPTTVRSVDLNKYSGTWYEIARYPNSFEKDCEYVTATYTPKSKHVEVINACTRSKGRNEIKGKAFPVKGSENTKLKVQFFWPFRGGYWIIALDKDYQWALVGSPSKNYFWILSRTPKIDDKLINHLHEIMISEGYNPEKLHYTKQ